MFGLGSTLAGDFQRVRTLDFAASDYKTLYASADLFRQGGNSYDLGQIAEIHKAWGVVLPHNPFGHMPVYPPVTLLVLWPLTYTSMAASAVVWAVLSAILAGAGLMTLLAEARAQGVHWVARLGLIAFCVVTPLLGYAIDLGNVSPAVGALATIALMLAIRENSREDSTLRWQILAGAAAASGLALCLKPHLAIWISIGMALVCGRAGRWISGLGVGLFAVANAISLAVLWDRGELRTVMGGLITMLQSERISGSMSPASREVLPIGAQITGLDSLLGLWVRPPLRGVLVVVILTVLFAALFRLAARARSAEKDRAWQVLFATAIAGVGMLASYHRAHDAVLLSGLAGLWVCVALQRVLDRDASAALRRPYAIGAAGLLILMAAEWFDLPASVGSAAAYWLHAPMLTTLLGLRQGAVAAALLAVWMTMLAFLTGPKTQKDGTDREVRAGRPVTQLVSDGAYCLHRSENM